MTRARLPVLVVLLAPFLAFGACRSFPPPPDHSDLDVNAAREFVKMQALSLHSLEAQVTLSIESRDFSGALDGALVVAPPDRLRLRTSKMMQDVFDLVVTPEQLELWWFPDRVLYRRSASPGDAAVGESATDADARALSFLRTLDPWAMRASLTAYELPPADPTPATPWQARSVGERVERDARALVVTTLLEGGGRLTRDFDGATLLLRSVRVERPDGTITSLTTYDDYRPVGPLWLPETTKLEDRRFGLTLTMSFSEMAVNDELLPGAFRLEVPAGARVCAIR